MPDPTREQFEAAAQRVMQTAPAGLSREDFFALIDAELVKSTPQPISEDDPDTYIGGFLKGAKEGVVGGAKGFAKGLARSPLDLAKGVADLITTNPLTTARNLVSSVKGIPEAIQSAGSDPETWGKGVGSLTGQQLLTAGAAKGIPKAGRLAGTAFEAAGRHQFPWQIAAAHQMMGGNILGGVGLAAAPEVLGQTGHLLKRVFGSGPKPGASRPPTPIAAGKSALERELLRPDAPPAAIPSAPPQPITLGGQKIPPTDPLHAKLMEILGDTETPPVTPITPATAPAIPPGRVTRWKPGKGPQEETIRFLRNELGSKGASKKLGIPAEEIKKVGGVSRLPDAVRRTIDARLATLKTAAEQQAYLDAAPNAMAREYIASQLKRTAP